MIEPGTILFAPTTPRPDCFHLEAEPLPNTWMSMKHDLTWQEREAALTAGGWTFFYMANVVDTRSFGFNRSKMLHAALARLIAAAKLQHCNCLEIDKCQTRSFLGLPYINVSAHPRHLQKGIVFSGE